MLAAVGIEVGVVARCAVIGGHHTRRAEKVLEVVLGVAACGEDGDALAGKENVFVEGVARSVSLAEDFAAGAIPVEFAIGFGDAASGTIVGISDASGGLNLRFGVVGVGDGAVAERVAGSVVAEAGNVIIAVGGDAAHGLFAATVVIGRPALLIKQVGPSVVAVLIAPAVGSGRGGGSGSDDAIEGVVGKALAAAGIEVVGDGVDMASVSARSWINEAVRDIEGVAGAGGSCDFKRLQSIVISFREVDAVERGGLAEGGTVFRPLRCVSDFLFENSFICV